MTDAERWLEKNTAVCPVLHARITPAQCAGNRTRPDNPQRGAARPPQCINCPGVSALAAQRKEEDSMAKIGKCDCCKEGPKQIVARGLCGKCYRYFNFGQLEQQGGVWVATTIELADRLGIEWSGAPDHNLEPLGDGAFAAAGNPAPEDIPAEIGATPTTEPDPEPEQAAPEAAPESVSTADPLAGFVPYTGMQRRGKVAICIQASGKATFTAEAVRQFGVDKVENVALHFNPSTRQVAVELAPEPRPGLSLLKVSKGRYFCFEAKGFLSAMQITPQRGQHPLEELRPGLLVTTIEEAA